MMMSFRSIYTLLFLLVLSSLSAAKAEISFNQIIASNYSDENVLKTLLMHNAHMVLKLEQMEQKLEAMEGTCVNKNELPILIEDITRPSHDLSEPTGGKNYPFMNIPYREENIPSSTEMPLMPTMNLSSVEQMLKLLVRRSCYEWLQAGFVSSGIYTIDADGQGIGDPPFQVYCDMVTGYSFLRHDMEGERQATQCTGPACFKTKLTYSTSDNQIRALIRSSDSCHQFIQVDCYESPLKADGRTLSWWKGADGERHNDWAGELYPEHICACGYTGTCVYPRESCHCDSALSRVWVTDKGLVSNMSALPIQEVAFGSKHEYTPLKVRYTIGPLQCHGLRKVSYPSSCLDLFVQGSRHSGWYVVGQPESLRFTFCNMEDLHQSEEQRYLLLNNGIPNVQPTHVDVADVVFSTLQSRGFTILKQEQHDEMLGLMNSLRQALDIVNKTMTTSQQLTDEKTMQQENKLKAVEDFVRKNEHSLLNNSHHLETLHSNMSSLKGLLIEKETHIIFYATTQEKIWSAGIVIKYELVHQNMGGGYDPATGQFTAPINGLYYIAFYTRKYSSSDTYLYLRKNGKHISKARMRQSSYATTGSAVIVDLNINDKVEVYLASASVYGASDGGTSFMGYLLYKT